MAAASPVWIDRATAARILDVDVRAVDKLVTDGLVGRRDLPVQARLRHEDVVSLARLSLVPARARAIDPQL